MGRLAKTREPLGTRKYTSITILSIHWDSALIFRRLPSVEIDQTSQIILDPFLIVTIIKKSTEPIK